MVQKDDKSRRTLDLTQEMGSYCTVAAAALNAVAMTLYSVDDTCTLATGAVHALRAGYAAGGIAARAWSSG